MRRPYSLIAAALLLTGCHTSRVEQARPSLIIPPPGAPQSGRRHPPKASGGVIFTMWR